MLSGSYEGDPLSPPEGEAACGEHPLTPSFVGFFHQPSGDYRTIGDARAAGRKHTVQRAPKSDGVFLARISTERENHKKFFHYLSLLLSVCAFRIIVLIRFYQNKKMLLIIPDNNFLMDGTTKAGPGDDRWRRTR